MSQVFERALVTGGGGFLGSHLCAWLLRSGTRVVAVDNFVSGARGNLAELLTQPGFELVEQDITEPVRLHGRFDLVAHLAACASPKDYQRLPLFTLRTGALGTEHALEFARAHRARFLLASTSEVYGDPLEHPQRETYWGNVNPVGPRSVYDESKRFAEALTMAHRCVHHTDTAIARIFNTYGPGMRPDDGRLVPTFIGQALAGEPLVIFGNGEQTRSLCYVDDTVRGLLALAASGHPGPVNLGNPVEMSVRRIAQEVRRVVPTAGPVRHADAAVDDPRRRCPDITVATAELGWRPEVELTDGLRRTVAWVAGRSDPAQSAS